MQCLYTENFGMDIIAFLAWSFGNGRTSRVSDFVDVTGGLMDIIAFLTWSFGNERTSRVSEVVDVTGGLREVEHERIYSTNGISVLCFFYPPNNILL